MTKKSKAAAKVRRNLVRNAARTLGQRRVNRGSATADAIDALLATAENPRYSHARRAKCARKLVKRGRYLKRALAVLDGISAAPDRSITGDALDDVRSTLATRSGPRPGGPFWPVGWAGEMMRAEHGGTCIPIDELNAMSLEERGWPVSMKKKPDPEPEPS